MPELQMVLQTLLGYFGVTLGSLWTCLGDVGALSTLFRWRKALNFKCDMYMCRHNGAEERKCSNVIGVTSLVGPFRGPFGVTLVSCRHMYPPELKFEAFRHRNNLDKAPTSPTYAQSDPKVIPELPSKACKTNEISKFPILGPTMPAHVPITFEF